MWERIRYDLCLYGYPPHDAVTLLPRFIELVHQAAGQSLVWWHTKRGRLVPTSPEGWAALIAKKRDPEDGALDLTLASPCGLIIDLTADWPPVVRPFDVLSLEMAPEHLIGPQALFDFDRLYTLFTESIRLFRPFSARVNDKELTRTEIGDIYQWVDTTKVPATIYWFNYFAQDMVERLGGTEKLLAAPAYLVTPVEDPPGVILILQREVFDYHNPEHRARFEAVTAYFDLPALHARYPWPGRRADAGGSRSPDASESAAESGGQPQASGDGAAGPLESAAGDGAARLAHPGGAGIALLDAEPPAAGPGGWRTYAIVIVRPGKASIPLGRRVLSEIIPGGVEPVYVTELTPAAIAAALEKVVPSSQGGRAVASAGAALEAGEQQWGGGVAAAQRWRALASGGVCYVVGWADDWVEVVPLQPDREGRLTEDLERRRSLPRGTPLLTIAEAILEDVRTRPELGATG